MKILKKYGDNFFNLILGKSSLNIGDSFYMVAISVAFIETYHINVGELSLFALLALLPGMFAFSYGVYIERIKNKKNALILFQILHIVLVSLIIGVLYYKANIIFIYILNVLFMLVNTIQMSLEISIVPSILEYNDDLINKSIDIQYMTGNVLNIASDFVASVLLGFMSYLLVVGTSIPFLIAGVFFFSRLVISRKEIFKNNGAFTQNNPDPNCLSDEIIDTDIKNLNEDVSSQSKVEDNTISERNNSNYFTELSSSFNHYKSGGFASFIIFTEALLSGAIDMLIKLSPLYLILISVDIKWIGVVYATQKLADLIGSLIAPYVKLGINKFFFIDYTITGILLTLVFIIPNPIIKLVLFFVSFVIIGISGNYFNKMLFKYFDQEKLGSLMTIIQTLYASFGLIFLIIPMFYNNIKVLGIVLNLMTCVFGIVLLMIPKKREFEENDYM